MTELYNAIKAFSALLLGSILSLSLTAHAGPSCRELFESKVSFLENYQLPTEESRSLAREAGLDALIFESDFSETAASTGLLLQPTMKIPFGARVRFITSSTESAKTLFLSTFNYGIKSVLYHYSSSSSGATESYKATPHTSETLPVFFVYEPEMIADKHWGLRSNRIGEKPYVYSVDQQETIKEALVKVSEKEKQRKFKPRSKDAVDRKTDTYAFEVPVSPRISEEDRMAAQHSSHKENDHYRLNAGKYLREIWVPAGKRDLFIEQLKQAQARLEFSDDVLYGLSSLVREITPSGVKVKADPTAIDIAP